MSGKDGKRAKGRRNQYSHSKNATSTSSVQSRVGAFGLGVSAPTTPNPFKPFGSSVTMNVNDVATEFGFTLKPSQEDAMRITELMDAPVDLDIPVHAISRGPNPYLDRCMYCNTPRTTSQDEDDGLELLDLQLDGNTVISSPTNPQSYSSLKLEIWTCVNCRKVAGNFQSFLEANFPQASYDLPFLHERCIDPLSCARCQEERENHERETQELQENWVELRSIVKDLYSSKEEIVLSEEQGQRLQFLVDKLCSRDPHQLFLRLESQVREIVMDMKTSLLNKLKENGCDTPELALDFTRSLLSHYDLLTEKSCLLARYLGGLSEHLRRFKVTWELLNKHLFHSIAHNDPAISNSGPTILEHLRQGSVQYERSKEDPYCSVRKRLLKFQEEMSVVVVVWRDCQQLIESYCQEEVKNTQKQVSSKARSFINQQRQFLKEHLMKEPLIMDKALSETMKNLMSGHKTSTEKVLCHQCKRERCTCDECTITHMITCGIINSDKGEIPPPPNSFNFALDRTINIMDLTPPSMSSTTSSSGSVSPINIEDKLTTFYNCERVLQEEFRDEFGDVLMNCNEREGKAPSLSEDANDDIDDNAGDDEEEDDDDYGDDDSTDNQDAGSDEPHALQIPICELKDDELWEAMQRHHQQQQHHQHQHHQHLLCDRMSTQHNCVQCHQVKQDQQCPFQPRIDPELSRQLDAELAKSGLLPGGAGDYGGDTVAGSGDNTADSQGSGDSMNSNVCTTCQCHACLNQSGQVISTSLPLQMPVSPSPSELHLYPHIHGLPQHSQQRYMSDLTSQLMSSIKLPVKLDFSDAPGMQDHLYHAYSDWDNTMPHIGSLAAHHHQQHQQRLSSLATELPHPPLVTSASFTFDYASHLATHTTNTSTTNTTSAFKSVAGKHFTSSILPTFNNVENMASEGSSVDPSKPLDFASMAKIPQSCLNSLSPASFSLSPSFTCPSSINPSSPMPSLPVTSKSSGPCHGPPHCSRPATLGGNATSSKWERNLLHCKKTAGSGFINKQMSGVQGQQQQCNLGVLPFAGGLQTAQTLPSSQASKNPFPAHHHKDEAVRPIRAPLPCSHSSNSVSRPGGLSPHTTATVSSTTNVPTASGSSANLSCNSSNSLSTMVNNIGVGTSTPCNDPVCEAHHHDDNCDSVDDSCSEKSSSTSTSNQKEGKYCDCCYCEFFGHNNTQVAKTSTNYIEMKDRLRKKLKKRQSESKHKQIGPKNGVVQETFKEDLKDPLEKKGLEGLLSFINGTDDSNQNKCKEKELTAKAAKRARQKQKKLEEKARQEKTFPSEKSHQLEPEKTLRQLLLNQTLGSEFDNQFKMAKPKSKRAQMLSEKKDIPVEKTEQLKVSSLPIKQEINRSSLIIESTRSTINPSKDLASAQQRLSNNNSKDSSQQILGVYQSLKQQQKVKSQSDNNNSTPSVPISQNKSNGTVSGLSAKAGPEGNKSNGTTKQQPEQRPIQQKQQTVKSVNGKVSAASQQVGNGNHVLNGRGSQIDKKSQPQPALMNGAPVKNQVVSTTPSVPITVIASNNSKSTVIDSPGAGSGSSTSQSPSCGTKASSDQQGKSSKAKKNKKKNKNGDINGVDEIFMPKSESELDGDVDEFERELEEFKRFCFEPAEPKERRKIAVNVNLKDIFKKKTGLV
ncbi:protein FAM193A-like isoform X3 [Physella acuta]|uniref:protein FAM193A-like isoform X3 n=1 Tax=Physella acuta TaxID=109671 RepID=UPI0027DCF396|nr:protein FAM193A-like isoform X3 [Physella acuta]